MSSHTKNCQPLRALWLGLAAALCLSTGHTVNAAPAPKTKEVAATLTAPLIVNEASYLALKEQYLASASVACTTTASILSDYQLEDGQISKTGQKAFEEEARLACDYEADPHPAMIAEISYRIQLRDHLSNDPDRQRATRREHGLDSITQITAQELCESGKELVKQAGGRLQTKEARLCHADPINGALYFLHLSGFAEWYKQNERPLTATAPTLAAEQSSIQRLTLP